MRIKIAFVVISIITSLLFFQNCGGDIDYGAYGEDLSSQSSAPVILQFDTTPIQLDEGDPLSLAVAVAGSDLEYQWYKNNIAISQAEDSSYGISSVSTGDAGTYKVVVLNAQGGDEASVQVSVSAAPTPSPTPTAAPSPTPTPVATPTPIPKPVCSIYYQAKNDGGTGLIRSNGLYSLYRGGGSKECHSGGCGIRMGVSCTSGDQIQLSYQYKFFAQNAVEQSTPWSVNDGSIKWGVYSQLHVPYHVTDECEGYYRCGIRVTVKTKAGYQCSVNYTFRAEGPTYSPTQSNGAWAYLPNMGGRDKNCDDGDCGMRAALVCP